MTTYEEEAKRICPDPHGDGPQGVWRRYASALREAAAKAFDEAADYVSSAHGAGSHTKPQELMAAYLRARANQLREGEK
jgi:hypothetical protein